MSDEQRTITEHTDIELIEVIFHGGGEISTMVRDRCHGGRVLAMPGYVTDVRPVEPENDALA